MPAKRNIFRKLADSKGSMSVKVFLSAVSDEFRAYRDQLRTDLTRHNVEVKVQEDFKEYGGDTLDKLDIYISACNAVVHLVGEMTGAAAKPASTQAILAKYPDLARRLPPLYELLKRRVDISYVHWEAWLALYHGKALLIAPADKTAPRGPKFAGTEGSRAAQQEHLDRLRAVGRYPGATFTSPDQLAKQIAYTTILDLMAQGHANGADIDSSIPTPPKPYVKRPFRPQSRFVVGRQPELTALSDWVSNRSAPAFAANIFCLLGVGGVGKSALAWKWFETIAPTAMKPLAGRLWWSFDKGGPSFERFITHALSYVSGQSENAVRAWRWETRQERLLQYLTEQPYLFVLDGLERILIAYQHMDVDFLRDAEIYKLPLNGSIGVVDLAASTTQAFADMHRLRQTTDFRAGEFLKELTQIAGSRILITTRLEPIALQTDTGPVQSYLPYSLGGLSNYWALQLLNALNVHGSHAELGPILDSVEGLPLMVQLLAGIVAQYRKAPGNFARWRADHPSFELTSLALDQSRDHIFHFALKGLSAEIRKVLLMLVGLRMPTDYGTLEALLVGPGKPCRSAQDLDQALTELEDRGLISQRDPYIVHPIVRGTVWQG